MGPVDARIYLEEMSWNEGWNYFFLLITIRKNIRDFEGKKKTTGCLEILKRNNSLAFYIYVVVFVWNILFHSKLQLLVSPYVTHSQLFFCPN